MRDTYGLPLTTASETAATAFCLATDRLLSGTGDALAAADAAVAADPGFAIAHSARASGLLYTGDFRGARTVAAHAVELANRATRREQQHAAIVLDVVSGNRDGAIAKIREHVTDFPRDALAINPAAGVFGLIGFSGRRERETEQVALLEPLAPHYGDDWWFQHAYGFALLECDAVDRALPLVESAQEQRPDSGHTAHTWVHAQFEAGRHDVAREWLTSWAPSYGADGILYCHIWWHLALFHLLRGDFASMWAVYDEHCIAGGSASPAINFFTDGVALAWRAKVAGADIPAARWQALRELGETSFPTPGIFVDVHRAACLAGLGDTAALATYRAELADALAADRLAAGPVVLAITDGFAAFAAGDWARAASLLETAAPEVVRIGGSRAQRRLVSETQTAAAARSA